MIRFLGLLLICTSIPLYSADLSVIIKNIEIGNGSIVVEIYNNEKNFFNKSIISKSLKATRSILEFKFEVKDGPYAIAVYQDANENYLLDFGLFHIPTESYGLSNNFSPVLSAPTFNDCKFIVKRKKSITIFLK